MKQSLVYLGLGSNLGDRAANLQRALDLLSEALTITGVSGLYETEPVGYTEQPQFYNAACSALTVTPPEAVLQRLKAVEAQIGRQPSFPNGPRLIDIDLLFYDDVVLDGPDCVVPHPRLGGRAFVLAPLRDIAPGLRHPVLGRTVTELWESVAGKESVRRIGEEGWWAAGQR